MTHGPGDPLPTQVTLTADGTRSKGPLLWSVPAGAENLELASGAVRSDGRLTPEGRVEVRSKRGGGGTDHSRVRVSELSEAGAVGDSYEASLGVRTPAALRRTSSETVSRPVSAQAYPVPPLGEAPLQQPVQPPPQQGQPPPEQLDQGPQPGAPATAGAPRSMRHTGTSHAAGTPSGYQTRESYQVLDDAGNVMTGYTVNEKFTSGKVADSPSNWPQAVQGALTPPGNTFDDLMAVQGAGSPNPQSPQTPLGSTKVMHWGQEWRVGSAMPGQGTKVQTDLQQFYLDHAAHENITNP